MSWDDYGAGAGIYRSGETLAETVQLADVLDILDEARIGGNERYAILLKIFGDQSLSAFETGEGLSLSNAKHAVETLRDFIEQLVAGTREPDLNWGRESAVCLSWPPPESEAPTGDIVANGDMEADSDWDTYGTVEVSEHSSDEYVSESHSWHIQPDASFSGGIMQSLGTFPVGISLSVFMQCKAPTVEFIANGDMETDANWDAWCQTGDPPIQAQSSDYAKTGTYSRKVVLQSSTQYGGIRQVFANPLHQSNHFIISFWYRSAEGETVDLTCTISNENEDDYVSTTLQATETWKHFTVVEGINYEDRNTQLIIRTKYAHPEMTAFYIDDVSVVLQPTFSIAVAGPPPSPGADPLYYNNKGRVLNIHPTDDWAEAYCSAESTTSEELTLYIVAPYSAIPWDLYIDDVVITVYDELRPFIVSIASLLALGSYGTSWLTLERLQDGRVYEQIREALDAMAASVCTLATIKAGSYWFYSIEGGNLDPSSAWGYFKSNGSILDGYDYYHIGGEYGPFWPIMGNDSMPMRLCVLDLEYYLGGWSGFVAIGAAALLVPKGSSVYYRMDYVRLCDVTIDHDLSQTIGGFTYTVPAGTYDGENQVAVGESGYLVTSAYDATHDSIEVTLAGDGDALGSRALPPYAGHVEAYIQIMIYDDGSTWTKKP